jgi:hypothetical protein
MLIIDLTNENKLNTTHRKLLKSICLNQKNNFNHLVSKISKNFNTDLDWWVSSPSNRNTLTSNLYLKYCMTKLILILSKKEKIDRIYVDSKFFKNLLSQIISHRFIIIKKNNGISKYNVKLLKYVSYQFIFRFLQNIACKLSLQNHKLKKINDAILIDTYVLPGYYTKDRYFNGLVEGLSSIQKKKIYFVPTITYTPLRKKYNIIGNILSVYKDLRNSKKQYLIKEDYLSLKDIIFSIFFPFRIRKFNFQNLIESGIDYSFIFYEDLYNINNYNLSIEGILNYQFIKKLSIKNIIIKTFINWWENQPVDRGYNLGINKFFPKINSVGYLGYIPREFELHICPTLCEQKNGLLPKSICVTGKSIIPLVKLFNKNLNINIAPAFRYNYLWSKIKKKKNKIFTILLALPISYEDSINILRIIYSIDQKFFNKINFQIKMHPTMNKTILCKMFDFQDKKINFSENDAFDSISNSNLVITSMSIISMESIALGVPVIIIDRETVLNYNPVPDKIPKKLWKLSKDSFL